VLREVVSWLNTAYKNNIKMTGIVYLHRISDRRVGHVAMTNLIMFKKLVGEDGLGSVVLATTMWGKARDKGAEDRERDLQDKPMFWRTMIQRGSRVFRQDSGRKSAAEIINYLIDKKQPVVLDIQREMIDKKMKLVDTGAGREVATEAEKRSQKWAEEVEALRKELREANAQRDNDARAALGEITSKIELQQEFLGKLQANDDQLHQEMKEKYEKKFAEMAELLEKKDKEIEDARNEANELNREKLELDKMKLEMRKREMYYNATRCIVM
jgi:hypothetical protein